MNGVDEAVAALLAGKLVLLPTDTVYGLCAEASSEAAVHRLAQIKGRPASQPVSLLARDLAVILDVLPELRSRALERARALLPGAFTVVLPNPGRRFPWLTGSRPDTIGIRVPVLDAGVRAVLARVGAVAATSANDHGSPDPARLEDVPAAIRAAAAAELDGGELPGTPSTVVDLTGPEPVVLREGAVPAADALARLG